MFLWHLVAGMIFAYIWSPFTIDFDLSFEIDVFIGNKPFKSFQLAALGWKEKPIDRYAKDEWVTKCFDELKQIKGSLEKQEGCAAVIRRKLTWIEKGSMHCLALTKLPPSNQTLGLSN